MSRRAAFAFLLLLAAPGLAAAAPQAYRLVPADSTVSFEVDFGPDRITGTMPVRTADMTLDFDRPADSRVTVALDAAAATASFPFATQALTGPSVLATADHPDIRFETTAFRAQPGPGARAEIDGLLTIRDTARPVTLEAEIFRQQGAADGDLSALSVHMATAVSRTAFGADGWSDMVGDEVRIRIVARIARAD
jgi:polyisoprenoid-binding protein YceI